MTNKPQFVGERETVKLSEIAKIKAGNVAPKKDAFTEDGIPFVRAGSLTNLLAGGSLADLEKIDGGTAKKLRLTLFPAGTVVFAKSGMSCMTGNVYVLPKPCYVVSHLACVIPNGNYASYLKHYFRFNRPNRLIENPSFPSIKLSKIQGIELRLPSSEEGVKQVQALERIESQIEQAKALLTYLDFLVKSRFVEMFGDLKSNKHNWPIQLFESFAIIDTHMTNSLDAYANKPHIGIDSIESNSGRLSGYRTVAEDGIISGKYPFTEQHIIYSKIRPALNKVALPDFDGVCSADAYPILPIKERCNRIYLAQVMRSAYFLDYVIPLSGRAQMPKVNKKALQGFSMPLPPLELQQKFADFVTQVDKSRFAGQLSALRLTRYG